MIVGLLKGIGDKIGDVVAMAVRIITNFLEAIGLEVPKIVKAGYNMIISLIDGLSDAIRNDTPRLMTAIGNLGNAIIDGLIGSIKAGVGAVGQAITNLANEALAAFGIGIKAHSPSKAFYERGEWITQGLTNGIRKTTNNVAMATNDLGKTALSSFGKAIENISDGISNGWDLTPTITPVVDMSNIKRSGQQIGSYLGANANGITVASAAKQAAFISAGTRTESSPEVAQVNPTTKGSSVTFNQYNYSPEALSAIDIYRRTRNQLIQAKGLVPNT